MGDRSDYLLIGEPGEWDDVNVRGSSGPIVLGDKVLMYYCGVGNALGVGRVGFASWRRDGFVSLHAGEEGGELLTKPFVPSGPAVHLNVDASQGEVSVRVCDNQGKPFEGWSYGNFTDNTINSAVNAGDRPFDGWYVSRPSQPIRGDHLDAVVKWENDGFANRIGKPITLRIQVGNADLYSYWTE